MSDAVLEIKTLTRRFAAFSIVSARERRWFWATMPSKTVVAAVMAETLLSTVLTFVGLPGLMPLPWWQPLAIFVCALVSCLVVNDTVKVALIQWRVPTALKARSTNLSSLKGEPCFQKTT
jgi:hypothetical protein